MSINLITGQPGTGKTTFAVHLFILKYMEVGIPVYTNIKVNLDLVPEEQRKFYNFVIKREDILHLRSGVLVLDEGQVWFNARNFAELPEEMQFKFQEHRHDDLHLWILTQNARRLDVVIRELVVRYARTRLLLEFRHPFKNPDTGTYELRSPFLPHMGIGIKGDPDYARFALDFYDMEDLTTADMRPRKDAEPIQTIKMWLTPAKKQYFNTKQNIRDLQNSNAFPAPTSRQGLVSSRRTIPLPVRHERGVIHHTLAKT